MALQATILNGEKEAVNEDLRNFFQIFLPKAFFMLMINNECSKRFKTFQAKIIHEKTHKDENFHYVCPKLVDVALAQPNIALAQLDVALPQLDVVLAQLDVALGFWHSRIYAWRSQIYA